MMPENSAHRRPRPLRPDDSECCQRGCEPCIFDYYHQALARWYSEIEEQTKDRIAPGSTSP